MNARESESSIDIISYYATYIYVSSYIKMISKGWIEYRMSMKLLYKAIQSHLNLFMARRSKAGATKQNHLQRQSDFEVSDFVATLGLPQIYTFWVTINMDANVRAAYYRCQRQTFDQVGPLYIVWSSGQVVDDFVHCQGWMSKNCALSRWNTWRRDLGNGVVRASRRHRRTRMRHPTLVGCVACWFGLRFGVQAHGVLRWHLKAFHHISPILLYHQPVVKSCSPKEMQTCSKSCQIRMFSESLTVTLSIHFCIFIPSLLNWPYAAVLALRPQKPGQLYWLDSKKIGVPSFLFEVRWFQDVRKIQEMNFSDGLSWFMFECCFPTVAAHQDQSLESCPPATKISKTIKISKLEKTQKLGRECAREAQLQLRETDQSQQLDVGLIWIDREKVCVLFMEVSFIREPNIALCFILSSDPEDWLHAAMPRRSTEREESLSTLKGERGRRPVEAVRIFLDVFFSRNEKVNLWSMNRMPSGWVWAF